MNIGTTAKLIASTVFIFSLAGCGGGGGGGGSSGGSNSNSTPPPVVSKYAYSTKVYIAQKGSNEVRVINAPTDEELARVPVGLGPVAIVVDDSINKAYVGNGGEKSISVIDTLTHKVVSTITTADKPLDLAIDTTHRRLYASLANNTVQVFNLDTQASMTTVTVDAGTLRMAMDAAAQRLYVLGTASIKVIDTTTNTVTTTLSGSLSNPYLSVGINSKLKRLYVGSLLNTTHVFDTTTNTEIATPVVNTGYTNDIFINPNDDKVYVGSAIDTKVGVMDANGTLLAYIATAGASHPERLAVNTRSNYLYTINGNSNELKITRLDGILPAPSGSTVASGSYQKSYTLPTTPSALAIVKPSESVPANLPAPPPTGGYGDSWKLLTANFNSVAFGNSLYVAVGDRGVVQTSPDGVTWTQRLSGVEACGGESNLYKVFYAGGKFVAVGDYCIVTSSDGMSWSMTAQAGGATLTGVAWSGTQYLAVGPSAMYYSTDALTWTKSNAFAMATGVTWLLDPVWYSNTFLIASLGAQTNSSATGSSVSPLMNAQNTAYIYYNLGGGQSMVNKPGTSTFVSIVSGAALAGNNSANYTNNNLASPQALSSVITLTQDGGLTKYVPPEMARTDGNEWNMVTYNPVKGLYVAVGGAGGSRSAYIYQHEGRTYQTPAANGIIATSADGVTWTQRTSPLPNALFGVSYNNSTGEMIAVGELGAIITSTDGVTWTARSGSTTALSVQAGKLTTFNEVIWGGPGAGMFVAIGDAGALYTSTDGSNWNKISVSTTGDFKAITWGGLPGQQKFVATVRKLPSVSEWAYTSSDGITWTAVARPAAASGGLDGSGMLGIVWNGSRFFGADLYDCYDSADGINWRYVYSHTALVPNLSSINNVKLRYDEQAKKFLLLKYWSSNGAAWGTTDYRTDISTSSNTAAWSDLPSAVGYRYDALFDATGDTLLTAGMVLETTAYIQPNAGELSLIEAGSNGPTATPFAPTKSPMSSGANHCVYYSTAPGAKYDCALYNGVYTADMVNTGSLMVGAGPGGIYTRTGTGLNWTHRPSGASYSSVAWNGSVFVAVGTNNIAVSR